MNMAQFSEFSYGYAMTDNILHSGLPHSPQTPIFLSQFAEGKPGGGYDVMIPLQPVPIFLQFKIPQVIRRRSIQMPPGYAVPYLRMHLRTYRPNQHQLMLDLEHTGKLVYYATPAFWTNNELDIHFTHGRVHEHSWYIRPTRVGFLDEKPHYVAYSAGSNVGWRRSELQQLEGPFDSENFTREINEAVKKASRQEPLAFLSLIKKEIVEVTRKKMIELPQQLEQPEEVYIERPGRKKGKTSSSAPDSDRSQRQRIRQAMREISYLSQVHLGCSFLIAGTS